VANERYPFDYAPWLELWIAWLCVLFFFHGSERESPRGFRPLRSSPRSADLVTRDAKAIKAGVQLGVRFLGALIISAYSSLALLIRSGDSLDASTSPDLTP